MTKAKTKKAKERLLAADECTLGGKRVRIAKLTPKKWKELVRTADRIPILLLHVATTSKEDMLTAIVAATEFATDEIVAATSILSGIDEEYLAENAGVDEIIDYFVRVLEYNNLEKVVKNVKRLLSPILNQPNSEQSTIG